MTEGKPIPNKPNRNQKDFKIEQAPTPNNTPSIKKINTNVDPTELLKNLDLNSGNKDESVKNILKGVPNAHQLLSSYLQEELGDLEGAQSDYIATLPVEEKQIMYALKAQEEEIRAMDYQYQLELYQLDAKYQKLRNETLYKLRSELINGKVEPKLEDIQLGRDLIKEQEANDVNDDDDEEEIVTEGLKYSGIESFWLTCLSNLKTCSSTITDRDSEVLSYLTNIKLDYLPLKKVGEEDIFGYGLIFEFAENPFFSNDKLIKTYFYANDTDYEGGLVYKESRLLQPIEWKSDEMNVTVEVHVKKQKSKKTGKLRSLKELIDVESFFSFFSPPDLSILDEIEDDDEAYEMQLTFEEQLGLDYAIAEEIKSDLIPRAIDWFTGDALQYKENEEEEDEEDDDDEEYTDDEDDENYDDDEEGEEEEDEFAGVDKQQPPECKQS
ncbi:NAP-domain-containing protein [Hanseniaspora valbyensis NRRL Y-1626]|uniref:NAP-domain-containing protein n=1 Tax=Hanseniaspora valbyensis NRRL Y-1626 TaxID=766949 RepID=A0A1B7T7C8_9ASCO|nr:NAP-domain-containing protein [Hanseniaspora valbyensis NRRL Y-1626]